MTEMIAISKLKPWGNNPRKNDAAVGRVAESIRKFGFANPILARKENFEIISGHTRLAAAKLLGLKEVPVRLLDLNEHDAHLLALADNKLGEIAEWDDDLLGALLKDMSIGEASFAGWDPDELGKFVSLESDLAPSEEMLDEKFMIVIECQSEEEQVTLLERFQDEGLKCRALI